MDLALPLGCISLWYASRITEEAFRRNFSEADDWWRRHDPIDRLHYLGGAVTKNLRWALVRGVVPAHVRLPDRVTELRIQPEIWLHDPVLQAIFAVGRLPSPDAALAEDVPRLELPPRWSAAEWRDLARAVPYVSGEELMRWLLPRPRTVLAALYEGDAMQAADGFALRDDHLTAAEIAATMRDFADASGPELLPMFDIGPPNATAVRTTAPAGAKAPEAAVSGGSSPVARRRPTVSVAEAKRWYIQRAERWKPGDRVPDEDKDWAEAIAKFRERHVTRKLVRELRRAHGRREWNVGIVGRKRNPPKS